MTVAAGPSTVGGAGKPPPASFSELSRREVRLTLAGVLLVMLLAALDQTVVGTAMPRIIADLHGFEHYAWVTTAFMLTSTAVVPIVGKLSDLYGRKRFYLAGLITRRMPIERYAEAVEPERDGVKTVIELAG